MNKLHRGVTLIELLTALAILALLITLLFPVFAAAREKARQSTCASNLHQIGQAFSLYSQDYEDRYPPDVSSRIINSQNHGGVTWHSCLLPYLAERPTTFSLQCPNVVVLGKLKYTPVTYTCGYAMNLELSLSVGPANDYESRGIHSAQIHYPASTVRVFDVRSGILSLSFPDLGQDYQFKGAFAGNAEPEIDAQMEGAKRHSGGANYEFVDGHVKWLMADRLSIAERKGEELGFQP
jgi:prepilin-type N-terminal cleavage/methylation domain-containing protein/prepilin-type processing-associated H-X9-DG protein